MMSRPGRLAGFVVVLGLTAGGCASHTPSPTPVASAPSAAPATPADSRTPLQRLMAAIPTEKSPVYHFSIKGSGISESGVIDPTNKIAEFVTTTHVAKPSYTEIRTTLLTRNKSWLKVRFSPATVPGLPTVPAKWMVLDPQKIKLKNGTPFVYAAESDPGYTNEVFQNASDLNQTGPGHFQGVTDLSETGADEILSAGQLKALGDEAAHVTFTAVVDNDGRLTTTTLHLPAAGKYQAGAYAITYDQYRSAAVPKLPTAAEQTEAPPFVYDWYS